MVPTKERGVKGIMAAVIILLYMLPGSSLSQCKKHFILNQSVTTEDISNGIDHYYQNLIIQDIALASQQAFREISLRLDYKIHYLTDQCRPGQIEISVMPVAVKCFPLYYHGFDISASIKPEKADLVFHILQNEGFTSDSLIFFDISLEKDPNLYTSLTSVRNDTASSLTVSFSRAVFHYTKSSYEVFRDRILEIDHYYAASLIADSARIWTVNGFLSETGNKSEMILRQFELERIISYVRPDNFNSVFSSRQDDLSGLTAKYEELLRLNNRLKAIIEYNRFESSALGGIIIEKELLKYYLDRFDYYHQFAFQADFRFVNFNEGLATPDFSNAGLFALYHAFSQHISVPHQTLHLWCRLLVQGFIERGGGFETEGNQLRALTYYETAYELSLLMHLYEYQSTAFQLIGRMKDDISTSYLEISRKSALTENPSMAVKYFQDAQDLFTEKDFMCFEPAWLHEYEEWLFLNFEKQAVKFIDLKNYSKALNYLNEIQTHCVSYASYPCPEQFHDWMRTVRDGIYHSLLNKTQKLLDSDELPEAGQVFSQAVAMRLSAGYRVDKDIMETKLEVIFRQMHYDELFEEGLRYFEQEEFTSALYYFNKAESLEKLSLNRTHPELFIHRQEAARQVIRQSLSDGRVKAWAYDFDGAGSVLNQVKDMLSYYQVGEKDSLTGQYFSLVENVRQNECKKVFEEYNNLMSQAESAGLINDFILAHEIACDAVNLSMDHLNCRIRDDEAWYQKVLLETPAAFQKMENELDDLTDGSYTGYLKAFQDLKNYYYRHKLLQQGVVFIPLFDRVIQVKDSAFLTGMLDHYIMLKDFDHAFRILERLCELGIPSRPLVEEQRSVAESLARRDAMNSAITEPWKTLESYTGRDKWYRSFKWSYKLTWLEETNWKWKYWPFIWKK